MPIRIGRRAASFYSSKFYKALASAVTRFYYRFNGVDSHVALPEITIGGPSRRLSFTVNTTQTGADWALVASADFVSNEGYVLLYVDKPDGLQLIVGTATGFSRYIFGEQAAICNGEDNTVSLGYEEGVVTAYLNGAPIGPPAAVDQVDWYLSGVVDGAVNLFGGSGARYLSGVAKNANFQGTLTANGQTYSELNYPIIFDNIGDTIVRETVNGDGPEVWSNPPTQFSTVWTHDGDGAYTSDGVGGGKLGYRIDGAISGGDFIVKFKITGDDSVALYALTSRIGYYTAGAYEVLTRDVGAGIWFESRTGEVVTVSGVSIKQTLSGQLINAQDADYIEV